ncbi:MAG: thiol-disulfide oxidoreductase DCC family protein [Chitinophagaceae bacterium]|nr:thiol-disulfide oxidoreductase DCC family protein [Chitinophagaceae bacterium]
MATDNPVILFDGVCNLCNRIVQFVIRRDKSNHFRFASLQGKSGQEYLKRFQLPSNDLNSFILVERDKVFKRSTAALRVARRLNGMWPLLYGFIIVPPFIRDAVYDYIAKNRYRWYGRREECMVPGESLRERFLD